VVCEAHPLAHAKQLRYNGVMDRSRRLRVLLVLALVAVVVAAAALLLLRGRQREPTPSASPVSAPSEASPLSTPAVAGTATPYRQASLASALLWVALGGILAVGMTFLILRRSRPDT
jgi:predicted metal-binding membrane protein